MILLQRAVSYKPPKPAVSRPITHIPQPYAVLRTCHWCYQSAIKVILWVAGPGRFRQCRVTCRGFRTGPGDTAHSIRLGSAAASPPDLATRSGPVGTERRASGAEPEDLSLYALPLGSPPSTRPREPFLVEGLNPLQYFFGLLLREE